MKKTIHSKVMMLTGVFFILGGCILFFLSDPFPALIVVPAILIMQGIAFILAASCAEKLIPKNTNRTMDIIWLLVYLGSIFILIFGAYLYVICSQWAFWIIMAGLAVNGWSCLHVIAENQEEN